MNRKISILIALTAVLLFQTSALAYQVSIDPIKNQVYPGEKLKYRINFSNDESYEERVRFNIFNWEPESDKWRVNLNPGETEQADLTLNVPEDAEDGQTILFLYTWSQKTDQTEKVALRSFIKEQKPEKEKKFFLRSVEWPTEIDPRKNIKIKVKLESQSQQIKDMRLRYEISQKKESVLIKEVEKELLPQRNTTVEIKASLNDKIKPVTLTQRLDFFVNKTQISKKEEVLEVKGYRDFNVKRKESSGLLGKTVEYVVSNNGTIAGEKTTEDKVSSLEKLFLSTEEGVVERGKLTFNVEVGSEAKKTVGYKVNYSPLLIAPFILVLVGYGVYHFTRKAELKKNLLEKRTEDKFEAKIEISFKNVSGKDLKDVKIIEKLPSFVNKIGNFGTLRPEVKKEGGKKLVWKLGKIERGEERILSYKAKSGIGIVGKAIFPSTEAIFRYQGESGKVHSKKLGVSSKPKVEEEEE